MAHKGCEHRPEQNQNGQASHYVDNWSSTLGHETIFPHCSREFG